MSVTQLYLVRHGETNWNAEGRMQGQTESDLSELGHQQARQRTQEMLGLGFGAAYCSSSRRTRQTIDCLLAGAVEQVTYREDLREIRVGPWEGRLHAELAVEFPELTRTYRERPDLFELEGAETFQQLQDRGVGALTQIAQNHRGEKVLVVSHGALIKASLLRFLGWPLVQMWAEPLIGNCSCSVIEMDSEQAFRVLSVADTVL